MSITADRLKSVDFSKKYYHTPGKLAMKAGTVINDPLVDLKGKRVGVQRASTYDRYATDNFAPAGIEVVRYGSQSEAFLDLTSGRLDATLADIVNIDEGFIKTDAGKGFALVGPDFTDSKYFGNGAGIAVRKGDSVTAEKLNAAIDAVRADGTYQKIQNKYFSFDIYGG
jgi:arginine/ornithine transport system substrate-binding protein